MLQSSLFNACNNRSIYLFVVIADESKVLVILVASGERERMKQIAVLSSLFAKEQSELHLLNNDRYLEVISLSFRQTAGVRGRFAIQPGVGSGSQGSIDSFDSGDSQDWFKHEL